MNTVDLRIKAYELAMKTAKLSGKRHSANEVIKFASDIFEYIKAPVDIDSDKNIDETNPTSKKSVPPAYHINYHQQELLDQLERRKDEKHIRVFTKYRQSGTTTALFEVIFRELSSDNTNITNIVYVSRDKKRAFSDFIQFMVDWNRDNQNYLDYTNFAQEMSQIFIVNTKGKMLTFVDERYVEQLRGRLPIDLCIIDSPLYEYYDNPFIKTITNLGCGKIIETFHKDSPLVIEQQIKIDKVVPKNHTIVMLY